MPLTNRQNEDLLQEIAGQLADLNKASQKEPKILPNPQSVVGILGEIKAILYPEYFAFCNEAKDQVCYLERLGILYWKLTRLIHSLDNNNCQSGCQEIPKCSEIEKSRSRAYKIINELPKIKALLVQDVEAAYRGDPAAKSLDEIILAYPGFYAIFTYRVAHEFQKRNLELFARIMSEEAHSKTGIDIHPGAVIGTGFFIDHGTGVVIGETTVIGDNVKMYQGVTLGALSFPKDANGNIIRGKKRHPTIENNVTLYAGATILGGETVIGEGAVIGGNVWITESVPPGCKVINKPIIEKKK